LLQAIGRGFESWDGRTTLLEIQRAAQQFAAGWQQWQEIITDALTRMSQAADAISAVVAPVVDALVQLSVEVPDRKVLQVGWPSRDPLPETGQVAELLVPTQRASGTLLSSAGYPESAKSGVGSRAYLVFKQLGVWLQASDDEVADAVGIGRTTPYAWQRDRRTPTPRTLRRVYQMSSALSAVIQTLGDEGARTWLYENGARRRRVILAGALGDLDTEVDKVVFAGGVPRMEPGTWIPDDRVSADADE